MTVEQLRDEIITDLQKHLTAQDISIVREVLSKHLQNLKVEKTNELATAENTNLRYVEMFTAIKLSKKSRQTTRAYLYTIKQFLLSVGNKPISEITSIDVEVFLANLYRTNTETSVNNHKRNLSSFFSWLVQRRIIQYNPCAEVENYKEVKKLIDHLEHNEFEQLKDACDSSRDRAILEFLRCTGCRVSEIVPLNINDIDFSCGDIQIYGEKTKEFRYVFLDKTAIGYLRKYIYSRGLNELSCEPLFLTQKGNRRLTKSGYENALHTLQHKANLSRNVYPHLFRKTLATNIVKRGGAMEDAGLLLGHTISSVTAQHYVYKDRDYARQIFDRFVADR